MRDLDRDLDRLRVELFRFGGDSEESCFERCVFFLLLDDFFSLLRASLDDESLLLSLEFFDLVDFFEKDVAVRSWSFDDRDEDDSERACLPCFDL